VQVSVVIPTLNELGHITEVIPAIEKAIDKDGLAGEIIIVDDSSEDGTIEKVKSFQEEYRNLKLIVRKERSFGSALIAGYNLACGEIIISMDVDSINPDDIIRFINKINEGYDLVLGSRHSSSGDYDTKTIRTKLKYIISISGNSLISKLFKLNITDYSFNYRAIRNVDWSTLNLKEKNSSILLEMIIKMHFKNKKVTEIPVNFKDRTMGESKTNLMKAPAMFIRKIIGLFFFSLRMQKKDDKINGYYKNTS